MDLDTINANSFDSGQAKTFSRLRLKTIINEKGCWLYQGGQDNDGHSTIHYNQKAIGIHRFSFHLFNEFNLESKSFICHKPECNNPNCWNPEHLYEGDGVTNNLDMTLANTNFHRQKTHCPHKHEYNEINTGYDKKGHRYCKECQRLKMQRRRNYAKS